ncbi:MAG: ATP-binding cassette domain-containing protein [Rhabdochlamydiaceae bacterium]|nr:ATP-binding cassette domain-containing protein [Candidatus Amphrikana amoebophyrae]
MENIVTITNLKKQFGTNTAVDGIDLQVRQGEIFGFLGPNGAGKTTTLRMLTTLLSFDEGEVIINGYNVATQSHLVRKQIGYVGQKGGSDNSATGRENLLLQGRLYGLSKQETKQETDKLIEVFALEDCIDRFVKTYSGGQQRRLEVALGMMNQPKVLFLDEPTTGLDPQNRANLWTQIQKLNEMGVTIFITSHYLEEVDFLAHRLAIMDKGKIVAVDTPTALKQQISGEIVDIGFDHTTHHQVVTQFNDLEFVREISKEENRVRLYVENGPTALPHILRLLDEKSIPLDTLKLSIPTLNDVFLKKTGRNLREGK